jgi:hypothetical protein
MNTETQSHLAAPGTEAVQVQAPSKRALADVLWEAANVWLCPPDEVMSRFRQWSPSCCAVAEAIGLRWGACSLHEAAEGNPVFEFLRSLGCTTHSHKQLPDMADLQGVRYMWLLLAMHVAEDEGLTV